MPDSSAETAKAFDAYEVIGIITPGTVVALLLAMEFPLFRSFLGKEGLSVGDFGLFVLVAFVLGHLVQTLGNLMELVVFPFGGLPSNWVRGVKQSLVTNEQRATLQSQVHAMEGTAVSISAINRAAWRAITTRAYSRVRTAGRSHRIDIANRTYGLCRGLAAALVIAFAWSLYARPNETALLVLLAASTASSIWRMRRAGKHYARGLILEFIDLPASSTP